MKIALVCSVLQSYEAVRRQLIHLNFILGKEAEFVLMDDGSVPSIEESIQIPQMKCSFNLVKTNDFRPWTQPRARNLGFDKTTADKVLFFDIDHVISEELYKLCLEYDGDRLFFNRAFGDLDENGKIIAGRDIHPNPNQFLIKRHHFGILRYDESFCGAHGSDDTDFNRRYIELVSLGKAGRPETKGKIYVLEWKADQFHKLERTPRRRTH